MNEGELPFAYTGGETTGFQSPASDYIEPSIDLSDVLDLGKPGIYLVRVSGQALASRGIFEGDVLVADTAAPPRAGGIAIAFVDGECVLATLTHMGGKWHLLSADGGRPPSPLGEGAAIWAMAAALVRTGV